VRDVSGVSLSDEEIYSATLAERLRIIRHGESAGNVARDAAHARGAPLIDIQARDVDVPLSRL
jgi:hypothetical protein